jgi:hypothetical protein
MRADHERWTAEDVELLRAAWPDAAVPNDALPQMFGRTMAAIRQKAHYERLGGRPKSTDRKGQNQQPKPRICRRQPRPEPVPRKKADPSTAEHWAKLRRPLTDAEKTEILRMRAEGMTKRNLAKAMVRNEDIIRAYLREVEPAPKVAPPPPANPRGPEWWKPLPPHHPIALQELERAKGIVL